MLSKHSMWAIGFVWMVLMAAVSFIVSSSTADAKAELTARAVEQHTQEISELKDMTSRLDERTESIQSDVKEMKQDVKELLKSDR